MIEVKFLSGTERLINTTTLCKCIHFTTLVTEPYSIHDTFTIDINDHDESSKRSTSLPPCLFKFWTYWEPFWSRDGRL